MKPLSAISVAKYFLTHIELNRGETISPLTLQHLLYFAQKEHVYRKLKPLFKEINLRWRTTPVVVQVWDAYKKYGRKAIDVESEDLDYGHIDEKIKKFLDFVYYKYSQFSARKLHEKVMSQEEIKRTEIGHPISFDIMYGYNFSLPIGISFSTEFKETYPMMLPLITEFKVQSFIVRRFSKNTLDVVLVSKRFDNQSEQDNVKMLTEFFINNCPGLYNNWIVRFRPKGTKEVSKKRKPLKK